MKLISKRFAAMTDRMAEIESIVRGGSAYTLRDRQTQDLEPPIAIPHASDGEIAGDDWADLFDEFAELGHLQNPDDFELIDKGLESPDVAVRSAAARALATINAKEAATKLAALLQGESNPFARASLQSALNTAMLGLALK